MAMSDSQIDAVIDERLESWGRFLKTRHATPGVIIGVDARNSQLVITTPKGAPDDVVEQLLMSAIILIRQGKVFEA
jgi:hypothetical protein